MNYYSLINSKNKVYSFKEAVLKNVASDGGLFFPEIIPTLPSSFYSSIESMDIIDIAYEALKSFIGQSIPTTKLLEIIKNTFYFDFPIQNIKKDIDCLELFHGDSLAFKDVGAQFMASCISYFSEEKKTILVATSGDTGAAVANAFKEIEQIEVIVLYPKNRVSAIQESQITTIGNNVKALEFEGSFDECQKIVKQLFQDKELISHRKFISANSINVGRWLPQIVYYFVLYQKLKPLNKYLAVSVPSGNLGNVTAGVLATKMGIPIDHFIISTNINDIVPIYLETQNFIPRISKLTISNAMDIGNPNNFKRLQNLFDNDFSILERNIKAYRFTDIETKQAIAEVYKNNNYILDPHGAVGYLGLKNFLNQYPEYRGIFLETAHPIKFNTIVEDVLKEKIPIPKSIKPLFNKKKNKIVVKNYDEIKEFLI